MNEDVAGDWRADDSDDEEPKYIWRNVTKNGDIKKCILVDGKMDSGIIVILLSPSLKIVMENHVKKLYVIFFKLF